VALRHIIIILKGPNLINITRLLYLVFFLIIFLDTPSNDTPYRVFFFILYFIFLHLSWSLLSHPYLHKTVNTSGCLGISFVFYDLL
jgi:hypothetical protein